MDRNHATNQYYVQTDVAVGTAFDCASIFLVFNRTAKDIGTQNRARLGACEQLALSCSLHLRNHDYLATQQMLDLFMQRADELGAVRLVRFDGLVIHHAGRENLWQSGIIEQTPSHIRIPITRSGREWGELEALYTNDLASSQLWMLGNASRDAV
ncbi:MAG: hypothetical protein R3C53_10620 [Pirellulaceae bacterium]